MTKANSQDDIDRTYCHGRDEGAMARDLGTVGMRAVVALARASAIPGRGTLRRRPEPRG